MRKLISFDIGIKNMAYCIFEWGESVQYENSSPEFSQYSDITPFRIKDAQLATHSSLITAPEGGVLNEKRCKYNNTIFLCKTSENVRRIFVLRTPIISCIYLYHNQCYCLYIFDKY